jgi:hypothetical protein
MKKEKTERHRRTAVLWDVVRTTKEIGSILNALIYTLG